MAIVATCVVVGLSWLTLPHLLPDGINFRPLVVGKAIFGAVLAAIVTPWSIGRVLR